MCCDGCLWKSSPRRRCHRASSARCFREFSESTVALSLALVPGDPVVVAESVRSTNGGGTQLGPRRPRSSGTRVQIQGGGRRARWKKKRRGRCVGGSAGRAVSRAVGWLASGPLGQWVCLLGDLKVLRAAGQ